MTYRKPWLVRAFFIILSLIFLGALPVLLPALTSSTTCCVSQHQATSGMWCYYLVICVPISVLSIWMSGPDDITFDLEQKNYHRVWGWPFFAKARTGTWKDFWGVYLGQTQGSAAYFCVGIGWWGGDYMTLERFSNRPAAEQFAMLLMRNLELEQVMPPRNLRPQARLRS